MKPFLPICALACALLAPPAVGAEGEADIVFVGDVMVAEIPGQIIARGVDPFAPFAALLQRHDLRIGNLNDGAVLYRIPDPLEMAGTSAAEGLAVDAKGNVYGGEVGPRQLVKHIKQ